MSFDLAHYRIGETPEKLEFNTRSDNRDLASTLVQQAASHIRLFTYDLEPAIYDSADFSDALKQLSLNHRHANIQILIQHSDSAVKRGHRLIELARRFSTSMHIHRPDEADSDKLHALLLIDQTAYLYKENAQRFSGEADFYNPLRCRELIAQFDELWARSQPDNECRRLHI